MRKLVVTTSSPSRLGRRTYDIMAAFWPTAPEEAGGKVFNEATKYVASHSPLTQEWSNSVLIEGDAAEGIAKLKKEDGPKLQVLGSSNLIQPFLRHGLIDERYPEPRELYVQTYSSEARRYLFPKSNTTGMR